MILKTRLIEENGEFFIEHEIRFFEDDEPTTEPEELTPPSDPHYDA